MTDKMSVSMLDLSREYRYMKKDIDLAIEKCLAHQKWILGPEVRALENAVTDYLDARHAIGASSGTDALVLSLRALAIKLRGHEYFDKSDQIITTPFTFTATGDAILRAGATPVFVDIDHQTYNIDPRRVCDYLVQHLQQRLNNPTNVVGILPVHLYGQPCEMDEIMSIAAEHNLFVVEDCAQAFGASWNKQKLGSIGTCGAFSFFPSKNLGGFGDGGMVSTNDDELDDIIRMLLKHGGRDKYNVEHVGYNARLDTLQAAIVLAKLPYLDEFNRLRREIAEGYTKHLRGSKGIGLPVGTGEKWMPEGHVFHQYTISLEEGKRDLIKARLQEQGVESMVYYPTPLHKMKVFQDGRALCSGNLPYSETASQSVLSIPMEPLQKEEETKYVIDCLKAFCED
jgi:dTDP-4-amino-4,6-dideoxygalactose transaminase